MTKVELARALAAVRDHFRAGRMSQDEFEAAQILLFSQADDLAQARAAHADEDAKKTAPYPTYRPDMTELPAAVLQEIGNQRGIHTPYQPPMSTSQHTLSVHRHPSTVPALGPTGRHHSPPPPSRTSLPPESNNHTPLSASRLAQVPTAQPENELAELISSLKDLSHLHRQGILNADEYKQTKTSLLDKLRGHLSHTLQAKNASQAALLARLLARK